MTRSSATQTKAAPTTDQSLSQLIAQWHQPTFTPKLRLSAAQQFYQEVCEHNRRQLTVQESLPRLDQNQIRRALALCEVAHAGQLRLSKEPYATHPIAVARLLLQNCPDQDTIIAGLLHDTIEDTAVTAPMLASLFSPLIAELVEGVTKLGDVKLHTRDLSMAESYRKMMLAMSRNPRVLIVKLADRIHNMATISALPRGKQLRIAQETDTFYAPLAVRIGMRSWHDLILDYVFQVLDPVGWKAVTRRLEQMYAKHNTVIKEVEQELHRIVHGLYIRARIESRVKSPSSIWRKLRAQSKGESFDFSSLSDVTAVRVIIEPTQNTQADEYNCYRVFGKIHQRYRAIPERFRDYISAPKDNGYRTLHTTILSQSLQRCEIQIRTRAMHLLAEYGLAAHWLYKLDNKSKVQSEKSLVNWISNVVDAYSDAGSDTLEGLTALKLTLSQNELVVFTPKGEPIALPKGATPVDFAYAIHTKLVGERFKSAKVNGQAVSPMYRLKPYDEVEITTDANAIPEESWLQMVKTARTRAGIRRLLRPVQKARLIASGREILRQTFANYQKDFCDDILRPAAAKFKQASIESLLSAVAMSNIAPMKVFSATYPEYTHSAGAGTAFLPIRAHRELAMTTAPCCYPVPGEDIIGISTQGNEISAHRATCLTLSQFMGTPERLQPLAWPEQEPIGVYPTRLEIEIQNTPGSLAALTTIIGREGANISDLRLTESTRSSVKVIVTVNVDHIRTVEQIVAAACHLDAVLSATRG